MTMTVAPPPPQYARPGDVTGQDAFEHVVRRLEETQRWLADTRAERDRIKLECESQAANNSALVTELDQAKLDWRMVSERCERLVKTQSERNSARDTALARLFEMAEVARDMLSDVNRKPRPPKPGPRQVRYVVGQLSMAMRAAHQWCDGIPF